MQISVEITNVIIDPEFNAAEIIITPVFSSGEGATGIQSVSKNGTPIIPIGGNVDITVPTKTSELEKDDVYTKTEINNKLSAVYKYKFSVDYYAQLPLIHENGDTYNVRFNDDGTDSGANYAWSDELNDWDSLGGIIGLATLTENGLLSKEDFAKLQNLSGTNTGDETQSSIGALVEATELTAIADDTKIAVSNSGVLNWFSGLRIKEYLTGFFAKLSGGNTFADTQNFDGMINHKAGEYLYTAASKTADSVNDTRVINSAGVEIHSICTVANAAKGGGTWISMFQIDNANKKITVGNNVADWTFQLGKLKMRAENGYMYADVDNVLTSGWYFGTRTIRTDGTIQIGGSGYGFSSISNGTAGNGLFFAPFFSTNGYYYNAASATSDAINDTRTVNTSGLWELFKCSLGNATKGLGTWIYGRLKLGMVIETDINEYADNAAALAAGLTAGMKYRTGDLLKIVH